MIWISVIDENVVSFPNDMFGCHPAPDVIQKTHTRLLPPKEVGQVITFHETIKHNRFDFSFLQF